MKLGRYWQQAEEDVVTANGRSLWLRVWGVSNVSDADAMVHAEERLAAAVTKANLKPDELGWYAYSSSLLREELLQDFSTDTDMYGAITRNRYGAMILNTSSLFIADIDVLPIPRLSIWQHCKKWLGGQVVIKDKAWALQQICDYQAEHVPHLAMRIYETCLGFRVIVTNKALPASQLQDENSEASRLLAGLNADPLYQTLCAQQACYRARLTTKPWRVKMPPVPNGWPTETRQEAMDFAKWLRDYDTASRDYKVCNLVKALGERTVSEQDEELLAIHDRYCLAGHASSMLA